MSLGIPLDLHRSLLMLLAPALSVLSEGSPVMGTGVNVLQYSFGCDTGITIMNGRILFAMAT